MGHGKLPITMKQVRKLKFRHSAPKHCHLARQKSTNTKLKNTRDMNKNHLTERKVCVVAALHTQGFSGCKAATNEGVLTPQWMPDVLRSNYSSLPVKLDHSFAYRCTDTFPCNVRRIAVRLPGFSRRLGDTRETARRARGQMSLSQALMLGILAPPSAMIHDQHTGGDP